MRWAVGLTRIRQAARWAVISRCSVAAAVAARASSSPHDPFSWRRCADIVGLYLIRADKALVLCVDEKSQVQALERTQPVLPMGLGYVEGVTHDYYRHGTTTLFAALDTVDGKVITLCKPRHRRQEFLVFLNHLDRSVRAGLDIHLVADNYGTHKHPKVKALAGAQAAPPPRLDSPDLFQLAQSGGALVRPHHPAGNSARVVPQRRRVGAEDRCLCRQLQSASSSLRVHCHCRLHFRKASTPL